MPQRPSSKKPGLPVCSSERGRGHQSSDKSVRDRNRKETNTRNKNLLRTPFRVLSCQPPAGDRGKKNQKIKMKTLWFLWWYFYRVWLATSLLILWHLLFVRLRDQHPCSLSTAGSHVLLRIRSVLMFLPYVQSMHTDLSLQNHNNVFWWSQVAFRWNLVGDLASVLIITWVT